MLCHTEAGLEAEAEMLGADHVILAGGSWSAALARDLGLRLLLQPGKGYSLTIEDPSQSLRSAAILLEASAAASSIGGRFRIGGTMELAGFDAQENATRIEGIKRAAEAKRSGTSMTEVIVGALTSRFGEPEE